VNAIFSVVYLGGGEVLILLIIIAVLCFLGVTIAGAVFAARHFRRGKNSAPQHPPPGPNAPPIIQSKYCPNCHAPMPADAPEGLCPQCLARVALGTEPATAGATINVNPQAEATIGARISPNVAQLASQFPQLEIIELLGMGGMGMVYKARQPRLDRLVALKILPVESQQHPSFAERFAREAKALAKLNHPGIVTVYDFGQTDQYYYFIMEYVDGMNLRQLLKAESVTPQQALELVVQICTALQYAHDEGVVHRDIKPENILLNKKGRVKIADFGLAKLMGTAPDTALTMSQATMGTFNYMAPEQRQNAQSVDHRADIYSLGVVFYEMLTGEVPMGRFDPPSKKVHVDVRLDEVVLRALEREPARRYQHASEVKSNVETITSTPPSPHSAPITASAAAQAPPVRFPVSDLGSLAGLIFALYIAANTANHMPLLGWSISLAILLVAAIEIYSRQKIQILRERGLWPQLGESPSIDHAKRLALAGERKPAIKLYKQIRAVSSQVAKEEIEKLIRDLPQRTTAPPALAVSARFRYSDVLTFVLILIGMYAANVVFRFAQTRGSLALTITSITIGTLLFWSCLLFGVRRISFWLRIRKARERGLWPHDGELSTLDQVKRLVQAGEKALAIELYRQIHSASRAEAKAAVRKLAFEAKTGK
jgi:serine/threonine protein kinase